MRGGRMNDPSFGGRMRGDGPYIETVRALFEQTARRLGLSSRERGEVHEEGERALSETTFRRPTDRNGQLRLF